jgi:hypothetical protein
MINQEFDSIPLNTTVNGNAVVDLGLGDGITMAGITLGLLGRLPRYYPYGQSLVLDLLPVGREFFNLAHALTIV